MGFFTSERARQDGHVTVVQLASSLMMFVAFSIIGGFLIAGLALPAATVAGAAAEGTAELFEELPRELQNSDLPQQSNIYARDGETLLATFYDQNRVVVPLEEISPWMQKAQVAIEDRRFWDHNGVDGRGIARAAYVNFSSDTTEGASTLTQQLVKNTLIQNAERIGSREGIEDAREVSAARKIREIRLALAYEENVNRIHGTRCTAAPEVDCGKEQVLEQYLNIAQYGTRIYGVETAAQFYFGKPAAELTAIEAATIAGITQNPSKWDPVRFPENAQERRDTVLYVMWQQGEITEEQLDTYTDTPIDDTLNLTYPKVSCSAADEAPFFCDYVTKVISRHPVFQQEGMDLTGDELLTKGGLDIVTTLDIDQQIIANEELRDSLPMDDENGYAMALVSLDTETGEILAMAQNREFDPSAEAPYSTAINYAVDREYGGSRGFSPGSTFKAVILAEWLNSGRALQQIVSGDAREWEPSSWRASCLGGNPYTGRPWRPFNSGGGSSNQQTVLNATANSTNTSYVAMANQLDLCNVAEMAETLGYQRSDGVEFEIVPSMTLGSQNASPLGMASMFQTFANRGVNCEPISILSITNAEGESIEVPEPDCRQAISSEIADGVTHALKGVLTFGSGSRFPLDGRESAGKTGTSQDNAHTWFAGYTRELTSVVWLGHPDRDVPQQNVTINGQYYRYVYGGTIAGPTWKRFMDRALEGVEPSSLPNASSTMMAGLQMVVPDVVGLEEDEAQYDINDAGFTYAKSDERVYDPNVPRGTIIAQSPEAGSRMTVGGKVTYIVSTDKLPSWWTTWPPGWDPLKPPDDWWGDSWPPAEWGSNPPNGWNPNPPEETPPPPPPPPPSPAPSPEPDD